MIAEHTVNGIHELWVNGVTYILGEKKKQYKNMLRKGAKRSKKKQTALGLPRL